MCCGYFSAGPVCGCVLAAFSMSRALVLVLCHVFQIRWCLWLATLTALCSIAAGHWTSLLFHNFLGIKPPYKEKSYSVSKFSKLTPRYYTEYPKYSSYVSYKKPQEYVESYYYEPKPHREYHNDIFIIPKKPSYDDIPYKTIEKHKNHFSKYQRHLDYIRKAKFNDIISQKL